MVNELREAVASESAESVKIQAGLDAGAEADSLISTVERVKGIGRWRNLVEGPA